MRWHNVSLIPRAYWSSSFNRDATVTRLRDPFSRPGDPAVPDSPARRASGPLPYNDRQPDELACRVTW